MRSEVQPHRRLGRRRSGRFRLVLPVIAAIAMFAAACSGSAGAPDARSTSATQAADPVIAAAGDIACAPDDSNFHAGAGGRSSCHEGVTSDLVLAGHYDAVMPLGDDQYDCGVASAFAQSYDPSWGRFKAVTRPVIGNHEYGNACHRNDPSPYFDYFGASAGADGGYYSFDLGAWHVVVLNSECSSGKGTYKVGGCQTGSPQERWLTADLAAHPTMCTLAAWHEPRFSSGEHGDAQQMADVWNDLVAAHVDVVLSGHNHDYERFDPIGQMPGEPRLKATPGYTPPPNFQQPILDPNGIREIVVGTGGKNHYAFTEPLLTGERVRNSDTYGILSMTLHPNSYSWTFLPEPGHTFTDKGTASCH